MCLHPPYLEFSDVLHRAVATLAATADDDDDVLLGLLVVCKLRNAECNEDEYSTDDEQHTHGNKGRRIFGRKGNQHRPRLSIVEGIYAFSDKDFRRRFKVTKPTFRRLVQHLNPLLQPDELGQRMAEVSSGCPVPTECRLAATLRWLAGSNFSDAQDLFGIGLSTLYVSIWDVIYGLDTILEKPFNPYDIEQLTNMAMRMHRRSKETIHGCIGALDGMAMRIKKPCKLDEENCRNYMNRKGFYIINLQAVADADRKIVYFSLDTQGSTHESLAWKMCTETGKSLNCP